MFGIAKNLSLPSLKKERKQTTETRDGRRTGPHLHEQDLGRTIRDTGERDYGSGERIATRRGLGRVHPHDRVPGIPLSYRTGCTRRHGGRRGPPTGCALLVLLLLTRDSDRLAARCSVDSLLHWRSHLHLATCLQFLTGSLSLPHRHTDRGGRGGGRRLPHTTVASLRGA